MAEETIEEQKPEEEGVEIELDAPEESKEEVQEPTPEPEIKIEVEEEQPEEAAASEEPKDEVDEYGVKVQARIKKLTEKYRKEERDREEAVRMAEKLLEENKTLKSQVKNLDKGYVSSEESRLETEIDSLKRQYKEAYEAGDTEKIVEVSDKYISNIQPDVKLVYENEKPNGEVTEIAIPIGVGFFWPDAGV